MWSLWKAMPEWILFHCFTAASIFATMTLYIQCTRLDAGVIRASPSLDYEQRIVMALVLRGLCDRRRFCTTCNVCYQGWEWRYGFSEMLLLFPYSSCFNMLYFYVFTLFSCYNRRPSDSPTIHIDLPLINVADWATIAIQALCNVW